MDKEIIKRNFSKCAKYYDRYSHIQNLCALRLIEMVRVNSIGKILDIGCGTGNYTKLLKQRFPLAFIKAIDISYEMIKIAKEKLSDESIEFITADAERLVFEEQFDFISSNASFQWFEDLQTSLLKYRNLLRESGVITFSIFGPLTFYELNDCLRELWGKDILIDSTNFMEKSKIRGLLNSIFREVEVEKEVYKERHNTSLDLLRKIKYSGIRGIGIGKRGFWSYKTINKLERIYKDKFKEIIATYEVFFCRAEL